MRRRESEASASSDMSVKFSTVALWAPLAAVLLSGCVFTHTVSAGDLQRESQKIVDELMMDQDHLLQHQRSKRNILFPSGVKLCTQETLDQAAAAHLSFFHLRVCQESVWEAFKIFWDRLPERDEYHQWVSGCMNGSVSIMEMGSFFSQSHEHVALIKDRVTMAASMNSSGMTSVLNRDSQADTKPVEDVLVVGYGSPSVPEEPIESENIPMQVPQIPKTSGGQAEEPGTEEPVGVVIDHDGVDVPDSDSEGGVTPASWELLLQDVTEDFHTEASVVVLTKSTDTPAAETVTTQAEETSAVTTQVEEVVGVLKEPVEELLKNVLQEPEGNVQYSAVKKPSVHKDASEFITGPVTAVSLMMEPDSDSEEAEVFISVTSEPEVSHPFSLTTTHMVDIRENAHTEMDEATHEESISVTEYTEDTAPEQTQPEGPGGTLATVELPVDVVQDEESVESTSATMMVEEEPVKPEQSEASPHPAEEEPEPRGGLVEGIEPVQEVGADDSIKLAKDTKPSDEPAEEPEVVVVEETPPGPVGDIVISINGTPAAPGDESLEDKVSPGEAPTETETDVTEEMSTQIPQESEAEIHPAGVVPEEVPELQGTEELPGGSEVDIMSELTEDDTIQVFDPSAELLESEFLPAAQEDLPSEDLFEAVTPTDSQTSLEEDRVENVTPEFHEDNPLSGDTSLVVLSEGPPKDIISVLEDVSVEHTDTPAVESPQRTTTEKATSTPVLEVTTNYLVEYNNGNFPDLIERAYVVDQDFLGNEGVGPEDEQENSIGNDIDNTYTLRNLRPLRDQVVKLSIKLRGETYNDDLRDPGSLYYQQLARQFTRKIEDVFQRLPGFKGVQVVEFRPQKDLERGLVVLVHYAITLEVESGGIPNDTLDFIALQNNLVEKNYPGTAEQPTVVYTITDFRNYITEALHKDNFMTNSSLDTQRDPLLLENAENLLLLEKPTSHPTEDFNNMDNVLAAEKPPDAPSHELDGGSLYLRKDDFLFDPLDGWKGPQDKDTVSENDVFMLEESAAPQPLGQFPERTLHLGTSTTENLGNIEDEGYLLDAGDGSSAEGHAVSLRGSSATTIPPLDSQKTSDSILDEGSGSAFSGDGQESDMWSSVMFDFRSSLDVLPPPDLEEEDGDEDMVEVLIESTTEEDKSPPVEITDFPPPADESLQDPDVQEPFLDQIRVTPHVSTDQRHSSPTQAPVFAPRGTLAAELSLQTFEASGDFDEFSLTEPHVTSGPAMYSTEPDDWSREELVFIGPTNLAVGLPETTQNLEIITVSHLSFIADDWMSAEDTPEMDENQIILPAEFPEVHEDSKLPEDPELLEAPEGPEDPELSEDPELLEVPADSQVPDHVTDAFETEAPPTEGPLSVAEVQAVTIKGSASDVVTKTVEQLLAERKDQQKVQILEEQHIGTTDLTSVAPAVELIDSDLVVDEVMVVMTTTVTTVTASSVSLDQSIALHPERDSPFTRVSDSVPEDEDLHHEHLNHEDMEEVPVRSHVPQSPPTEIQPQEEKPLSDSTKQEGETSSSHKDSASSTEIKIFEQDFSDKPSIDVSFDIFQYGEIVTEADSGGFSSGAHGSDFNAMLLPTRPGWDLTVFFSLRVTNMAFSNDLFNKSSSEYKALEQRFLLLLVPHLQTNLNNFQNLEILNFRNGSIVVNSRMRFDRPVSSGLTNVVYLILEDFANTASHTMDLNIDKYSLDVESGDRADPCKFQACNEFSRCMVNQWSGEVECVCDAGYLSVDGLPCQSVCDIQHNFCLNDGKCDIIPGKGAICRCRVGENWWYRGEHCEEYVSEPLVVGIAIASVAGFLLVAGGILFFLARMLREQYDGEDTEDPVRRGNSMPTLERATKFSPVFESDSVTAQHYRRHDDEQTVPLRFLEPALLDDRRSLSVDGFEDQSSEEQVYQNSGLSAEEIQERLRIIQLCTRDQHFADFVRQTQVYLERRGSSTT